MSEKKTLCVAKGDGIGSEIMDSVLQIFEASGVALDYDFVEMGKEYFLAGHSSGMTPRAKELIESKGLLFKGPMETPKGKGNKSINVTARKIWNTFANYRRFKSLPGVDTIFSKASIPIDITIVRENLEDTYGGVEHLLTNDVAISRRFISRAGSKQVHKYAFDLAKSQGVKTLYCGHKANIMKITDGMFLETFYEVAKDYPEIEAKDLIIDDLCMKLVVQPQEYQMIVLPNLQGDIVSDLCAGLIGGLGFAPSANIGNNLAIFEAVHGTAPDIAGQNKANPTALLLSGVMMLQFLGYHKEAKHIEQALIKTLQDGIHTADIKITDSPVSTSKYVEAIIERIKNFGIEDKETNAKPPLVQKGNSKEELPIVHKITNLENEKYVGCDYFIESTQKPQEIANEIENILKDSSFELNSISNRGTQVYPNGSILTECVDSWTLRVVLKEGHTFSLEDAFNIGLKISAIYNLNTVEVLKHYGEKIGFSLAQGQ